MKIKFAVFLLALFGIGGSVFGQGIISQPKTVTGSINGITRAIGGATVTVCKAATAGLPCSPAASNTIFSDAALTQPLSNPFTADANGNYQFAALPGTYTVTETFAGFGGYSYQLQLPSSCVPIGSCAATAGNNNFVGINTMGFWNSVLTVDGTQFATCAAAFTAAGANPTILIVPSTYAGAECPSTVVPTLTLWDFRGGAHTLTNNSVSWNQVSGSGLHSMMRVIQTRVSPSSSDLPIFGQSLITGTLPASQNLDGISGEVDTFGVISGGANSNTVGVEGAVSVGSTGGTLANVYGVIGAISSAVGNTTNITNAVSVYGHAYTKAGSETAANAYGVFADEQTAGGTRNYALAGFGPNLLGFGTNFNGALLDAEDNLHVAHRFLLIDSSNNTQIQAIGTNGIFFKDSTTATQLRLTSSGLSTPSQFTSTLATGTPPLVIASTTPVANLTAVPTTYSANGTQQTSAHIVQDTATLAAGTVTVTLTGSAIFTNATSYTCIAEDETAIAATKCLQNSGSSITITGTGTDMVRFILVGN